MEAYAVARIRGLRGRLLRPAELDRLCGLASLSHLIGILEQTDYGPDLDAARERMDSVVLVDAAVRGNLARRTGALRHAFESEQPATPSSGRRLLRVVLSRIDLHNLIAIARSLAAGADAREASAALLPAGELEEEQLRLLAEARNLEECVEWLRRWGKAYVRALSSALTVTTEARSTSELERALWDAWLTWEAAQLRGRGTDVAIVREALQLEVDAINLLTIVRVVHRRARWEVRSLNDVVIPGGSVSEREGARALEQATLQEVRAALRHTQLARAVFRAMPLATPAVLDEGTAMGWAVDRFLTRWAQAQVFRAPLGIAPAIAYHRAKLAEGRAIRLIARQIAANWPAERLRPLIVA
jgi:V/A-type H+/Na+-transporting ATPase subunit C